MAGYDRLLTRASISRVVKVSPAPRRVIVGAWGPLRPTNEQNVFGVIVETPTKDAGSTAAADVGTRHGKADILFNDADLGRLIALCCGASVGHSRSWLATKTSLFASFAIVSDPV